MNLIPDLANLIIDLFGLSSEAGKGVTVMLVALSFLVVVLGLCDFVVKFADKLGLIK